MSTCNDQDFERDLIDRWSKESKEFVRSYYKDIPKIEEKNFAKNS